MSSKNNEPNEKDSLIGKQLIKSLSSTIPSNSGIYQMIDSKNKIIYIGKAKNLKNRIYSYSNPNISPRINFMVSQINRIEWIITKSELDALLLEATLIKKHQPKYNILLKDDKTHPFIKLSLDHPFPRIYKYRAKQGTPSKDMFGPYSGTFDIKEYIKLIQYNFQIRTCSDTYFNNRVQPCILHQIKRCSAPCVNKISQDNYQTSITQLIAFLKGKNDDLKNNLITKMNQASENREYEQAIIYRERIKFLSTLASQQAILLHNNQNIDFINLIEDNNQYFFNIFIFRNGYHYGSTNFKHEISIEKTHVDIMEEFILQYYNNRELPDTILINTILSKDNEENIKLMEEALKSQHNKKVKISNPKNEQHKDIMKVVFENGLQNISRQKSEDNKWLDNFKSLKNYINMQQEITSIEIYDNSHLYGTLSLGVLVYAEVSGFNKKKYKVFHLQNKNISSYDDYGILKEVLTRRFTRIIKGIDVCPSLVFIDGGQGQLNVAVEVIRGLGFNDLKIVGIAKGENRNAGEETLFFDDGTKLQPDKFSSILHFIQLLRNEAHRFAINSVRKRKLKTITQSELDNIPEIGPKRKKILLNHFGSIENIKNATLEDLKQVKNINNDIASKIFTWFHS